MPKNSKDILSQAQSNIDDIDMTALRLGEYISSLNDIANEIAMETGVWIGRYIGRPRLIGYEWDASTTYNPGDIVLSGSSYYIAILQNTNTEPPNSSYWTIVNEWDSATTYQEDEYVYYGTVVTFYKAIAANTDSQPPSGYWYLYAVNQQLEYKINLPSNFRPYKIIRVLKAGTDSYSEMTEYSIQAVARQSSGNRPFKINDMSFIDGFSTQNYNDLTNIPGILDNSLTMNFSYPLALTDSIYIDYITGSPFEHETWNIVPEITIPDFLVDSFVYGLTYKMLERRVFKGNLMLEKAMIIARQQYKGNDPGTKVGGALYKAKSYAKNFKSENHGSIVRPFKFLAESEEDSF